MPEDEVQEITIEDFFELCKKGGTYQIDTPDGWQEIGSLVQKQNKECCNLVLENGIELGCSSDHYVWTRYPTELKTGTFYGATSPSSEANSLLSLLRARYFVDDILHDYSWKKSEDINVQTDLILTKDGWAKIVVKEHIGVKDTFDLEVKSSTHWYYSNDIVSHNTGKSMTCDALASAYKMPLLRLDFGAVFSAHVGESEQNIRQCLATAEAIAPCIIGNSELFVGGFDLGETILGPVPVQTIWAAAKWLSVSSDYGKLIENDSESQLTFDPPLQIMGYDLVNKQPQWTYMHSLVRRKSVTRLRITTNDGNALEVTRDHKLLVLEQGKNVWKKAKDLKNGDSIILVNNSNIQAVVAEDNTDDRKSVPMREEVSG